jgi:hypothetical protein
LTNVSDRTSRHPSFPEWDVVRVGGAPADPFADEVAIDFPSVGGFVDRARDSFLGEPDPDTHTADVLLSTREASRGAIVPLDVPVRGTCVVCGGRGESWAEPCVQCCGSGEALVNHSVRLSVPAGIAHGTRLRYRVRPPHAEPVRVEVRVAVRTTAA